MAFENTEKVESSCDQNGASRQACDRVYDSEIELAERETETHMSIFFNPLIARIPLTRAVMALPAVSRFSTIWMTVKKKRRLFPVDRLKGLSNFILARCRAKLNSQFDSAGSSRQTDCLDSHETLYPSNPLSKKTLNCDDI